MDFSEWNPYDLPSTKASTDQVLRSLSREHKFILKVLNDPTVLMDTRIKSRKVFDGLTLDRAAVFAHYQNGSSRDDVSQTMFWKEWKSCIPDTEMPSKTARNRLGKTTRTMILPDLETARASFRNAVYLPDLEFDEIEMEDTAEGPRDYEYERDQGSPRM